MLFFFTNKVWNSLFQQIHIFQTLNESSQHSFFFCAIFKNITCTPQSECFKKFFLQLLKLGVHWKKKRKKIPTRSSATRKDPISKVTYLKRGHLCKKSQLQSRGVQIVWSFPINKHNTVRGKERKPTQHNSICMCFIKKYILCVFITWCCLKILYFRNSGLKTQKWKQRPPLKKKHQKTTIPFSFISPPKKLDWATETAGPFSPGIIMGDWEISAKGFRREQTTFCWAACGSWNSSHDDQHSSKSLAFCPKSSASSPKPEIAWY